MDNSKMSALHNVTELLESLPAIDDQLPALQELKLILFAIHPSGLKDIISNVSFNAVFDCLNSSNGEQVELTCDILDRLLGAIPANVLLSTFHVELTRGLKHEASTVKLLCLKQIAKIADVRPAQLVSYTDILLDVIKIISQDTGVAKFSGKILTNIGLCKEGSAVLFHGVLLDKLREVMAVDDVVRYRVYEVITDISQDSLQGLQVCADCGMLKQLVEEINKNDVLVQLNCLDLLTNLAFCDHGLMYLEQEGIVGKLESMLGSVDSDPMMAFLLPGLIKFFGNVARIHPKEICDRYQAFVNMVTDLLDSTDPVMRGIAVQTMGCIGGTAEGKKALEKQGNLMTAILQKLGRAMVDSPTDVRLDVLHTVSQLLHLQLEEQTEELLRITEKWFNSLDSQIMIKLMSITRQPFVDLRCGTLKVYNSLAEQPWGQKTLTNHPGFQEYILDRSTEDSKEGQDGKFEIVQTVVDSPTSMEIFGRPFYVKAKAFYLEGPYFTPVESSVAIDDQT